VNKLSFPAFSDPVYWMGCRWQKAIHFEIITSDVLSRKWAYTASFFLDTLSECDRITFTHSVNATSKNLDEMLASGKFLTLKDKLLKHFYPTVNWLCRW